MSDYERVEQIILFLEAHFRDQPELKDIAAEVGLSEYHLQRLFRRWAGISPKRFLQYLTAGYARQRLRTSQNVLDVAYEAGLSGPGRLHDLTVNVYAATPGEIRQQGAGLTIAYGFHDSPFGECLVGVTERGICSLGFVAQGARETVLDGLRADWPQATFTHDSTRTQRAAEGIFEGRDRQTLSLFVRGTNFQIRVWEALLRIPPGALVTYGAVAAHLGQPKAARAVGSAVGNNPVAYLIPCHRVIRATGVVGDYRWQSARKRAMLGWEAAQLERTSHS